MFRLFTSKQKNKDKIDNLIIEKMKEYSAETEKTCRHFISYMQDDFPNDKISADSYGIYKARLGTNLLIASGAQFSKSKIGFANGTEFLQDVQIATALAHQPFSAENSSTYLSKDSISEQTGEIVKYIITAIKPFQQDISNRKINANSEYFKKLRIYFHSCISESVESKQTMNKIISLEKIFFDNLTNQNLKIMSDFTRI